MCINFHAYFYPQKNKAIHNKIENIIIQIRERDMDKKKKEKEGMQKTKLNVK